MITRVKLRLSLYLNILLLTALGVVIITMIHDYKQEQAEEDFEEPPELMEVEVMDDILSSSQILNTDEMSIDSYDDVVVEDYNQSMDSFEQIIRSPMDTVIDDVEALKSGDKETVIRYFGASDIFSPQLIADKIKPVTVLFSGEEPLESEDRIKHISIHICTLDYNLMEKDYTAVKERFIQDGMLDDLDSLVKLELAKNMVNGLYDVHYSIPVEVDYTVYTQYGRVQVTEPLKQALTGNWYKGINTQLMQVECLLR